MRFNYEAQNSAGERIKGTEEAADRFALARAIKTRGLFLISAHLASAAKKSFFHLELGRVSRRDLVFFASNLSVLLGAGLTLSRSLDVLKRQTKKRFFKTIISQVAERIAAGDSLFKSLANFPTVFPPVMAAMVRAGEGSGNLPASLGLVASQLQKGYELRRKVKGAMIYPALVMTAIVVIGILMMIFLVPTLVATFNDLKVELPLMTRIIVGLSNFLTQYWLVSLLGVIGGGVIIYSFFRSVAGQYLWQKLILKLPLIKNLIKEVNAAVIMRTISSLLAAGVGMVETLEITAGVIQNRFLRAALLKTGKQIEGGTPLSAVIKSYGDLFPILVGEMAEVGEETGDLTGMLLKGAEFYEAEVEQATKNLSTIIEPVLMIVVGIVVGLFAYSMIGPLYSISDAF
ncbi:MAG: type II secretion system F family protein [bacterium]|nr:type II secretion system F family protein [bacterium]